MTRFLASVMDAAEALVALEGGADIVDLKDPRRGALGALDPEVVRAVVRAVAGRAPVSAVAGEPSEEPGQLAEAVRTVAATGVDFVKIGLHAGHRAPQALHALGSVAKDVRVIAVLFADEGPVAEFVPPIARAGFAGVMLDTARKGQGRLLDHSEPAALREFVRSAKAEGLLAGLAGSLEAPDIPRLLPLGPDVLGFRGALCASEDRKASIDAKKVAAIRALIPVAGGGSDTRLVNYRLLADRHYARDERADGGSIDRIYVRDFVIPVSIGAYRHERAEAQRVRFNVVAEVRRRSRSGDDMGEVFSYDIITDAIRSLASGDHVAVVETLAEGIAAEILRHDAVRAVIVRVEKLDVGPGAVGVEIERRRGAETANVLELFPTSIGGAGPKAAS